ncbi:MAG: tripartite tricarboxylate transporter substrate binding protein, partial [Burkholderiaceae bacterium]|nr:tripartite tricarboxylate transporter substrate binding protein [Burkholderiaceae bacterium]
VRKLSDTLVAVVADPEFRAALAQEGSEPVGGSVEQFSTHVRNEVAKWARVVKESGATAD